ncbi:MAG: MBL fold metallo-hydrolase [Rhizomicrobium sp.]|jgi:glyoxylase-like metal-dependent hydrolase (beta-lactamase superfamily II)
MRRKKRSTIWLLVLPVAVVIAMMSPVEARSAPTTLKLDVYVADETAFGVTSTLIYGRREAILVDAQLRNSDAEKLADRIAATGRTLKAIFITHPDADHYIGLAVLHRRFPAARIYMTSKALGEFQRTVADSLAGERKSAPAETPNSLPTPAPLLSRLTVDGVPLEVLANMQGDYPKTPANSPIWIPALRTLIADDVAFNGVHPWLAGSSEATRAAWRTTLEKLSAMHPLRVVAGHKKSSALEDSPAVLAFMIRYLTDFDTARKASPDADAFVSAMSQKYPDLAQQKFLARAAKTSYAN